MATTAINNSFALRTLCALMPRRVLRMILLTSLVAVGRKINDDDNETLKLLNQVLQLASDDASLRLPVSVKSMVWKNFDTIEDDVRCLVKKEGTDQERTSHAEHILAMVPDWFKYSDPITMVRDIVDSFSVEVHPTAMAV